MVSRPQPDSSQDIYIQVPLKSHVAIRNLLTLADHCAMIVHASSYKHLNFAKKIILPHTGITLVWTISVDSLSHTLWNTKA